MLDNSRSNNAFYAPCGTRGHCRRLMLQLLLPLLLIGWCNVSCNATGISSVQQLRQGTHKLCGQQLNEAMDHICDNGYNTIQKRRSDAPDSNTELALRTDHSHAGYVLSPLLSSFYGADVLIKTRRMRRQTGGIHDECCVQSCTYYELKAYCR